MLAYNVDDFQGISVAIDLFDELERLTAALDAAGIPYALAGGLALAVHGAPRATKDIDLLVLPEDVRQTMEQARALGFVFEAMPTRFSDGMELRRVTKISAGDALTVDLLLVGPLLETAWASRQRIRAEPHDLWVISRDALIAMKLAAGRPQDLADVQRLQELDR